MYTKEEIEDTSYKIITMRFPYLILVDRKDGKVRSKWTWYCPKCNTPFLKSPSKIKYDEAAPCRCKKSNFLGWTKETRECQLKGVALKRGLKFLGWKEDYKNSVSRFFLKCPRHRHYEININNFLDSANYGCPYCEEENKIGRKSFDKDKFLLEAESAHKDKFTYEDFQYICSRTPSTIHCNTCNNKFKASYDNHVNKRRGCPHCKGKSQIYCYLLSIYDKENKQPLGVKFGIATVYNNRVKELASANGMVDVEIIGIWKKADTITCKDAEITVKRTQPTHYINKDIFPSGYTETIKEDYIESVIKIYEGFGGSKIDHILER